MLPAGAISDVSNIDNFSHRGRIEVFFSNDASVIMAKLMA